MERWLQHSQQELWSSPYSANYRLRGDQDLSQQHVRVMSATHVVCLPSLGEACPWYLTCLTFCAGMCCSCDATLCTALELQDICHYISYF